MTPLAGSSASVSGAVGSNGNGASLPDYLPDGGGKVTTGDLATFMLRELEAPQFVGTRVGVNR